MSITAHGIEVSDEIVAACIGRMKTLSDEQSGGFRASQIQAEAERRGVPTKDGVSMRIADRLVQREKKSGNIALMPSRLWVWTGAK